MSLDEIENFDQGDAVSLRVSEAEGTVWNKML